MQTDGDERQQDGIAADRRAERALVVAMFRMLSHDLRNPIASAKMAADGIARTKDLPDRVVAKARRASQALERADRLIGRCADLRSLVLQQPLPIDKQPQPLKAALAPATDQLAATYPGRLSLELDDEGAGAWDGAYMSQALEQLVDNAAKHGRADAPIAVRLHRHRGSVCLEVESQGEAAADAQWLAAGRGAPFRAEPQERAAHNGWGMGLAFVRAVAEAHRGRLSVDAEGQSVCLRLQFDAP